MQILVRFGPEHLETAPWEVEIEGPVVVDIAKDLEVDRPVVVPVVAVGLQQ